MASAVPVSSNQNTHEEFFAGNGEMAELMRSLDWSKTPVGPTSTWPQSLKTTVRILLTSRFAMWMAWGSELTFFCNDAYRPTLGVKHAWALGSSARAVWAEIWADIGPRIEKVMQTGEATWDEALLLFLERSGYPEETYHTFSYSPLADDLGKILGMLCVVTEETDRIIGERRMALLREVAAALASASTTETVFAAYAECIEANSRDLPFTLTYLFDTEGSTARLACATGVPPCHPIALPVIGEDSNASPWPLQSLLTDRTPIRIDNLSALFAPLTDGPWDKPVQEAIAIPIAQQGQARPAGFLIAALNPYRPYDAEYLGFVNLLAGQLASSLANGRAFEEEKRRADALAELDRAKTIFFSNVSHEFRTPLTLILGPVEDAVSEESLTLQGENLRTVHRNSLRLLKLVNTLLDFSRIEAGRVQASYQATDLSTYTAELASMFDSAVEKAGMRLILDCQPLPEKAFIDRDMWEKIVLNLLSNAFKFTFEGEIALTLREQDGLALLTVRDTGTGISEEQLPHIFERFHRVEGIRARTHEGTGIGLALVQELVKLHGGAISVESTPQVGTTFQVSIPLGNAHLPQNRITLSAAPGQSALHGEAFVEEALRWLPEDGHPLLDSPWPIDSIASEQKPQDNSRPCILLADDNADMRQHLQRLLGTHYRVVAVSDGEQALRAVKEITPDLVLSDVMMPVLDGFGLLHELRSDSRTATIPVILLSARAGEDARIEGLNAGADDYLVKPFSAREMFARVAAHLELARVRKQAEQALQIERTKIAEMNVRLQRAMTETHHRVKNNLQLMSALIDMQRASGEDMVPMSELARLGANIRALGIIHDILTQEAKEGSDQETLSIKAVLDRLMAVLAQTTGGRPLKYSFDDTRLAGRQTTTLALVTNELISNALKHGSGETGIEFRARGNTATFEVYDDGPGFPADFDSTTATNTGLELVENIVAWDLRGKIAYSNRPEGGARVTVTFPIDAFAEHTG